MAASSTESGETIELMLTPLMDVFSILVTFLLMSFSTDPVSHDVHEGVELPHSQTVIGLDEIPTITVTRDALLINDKQVTSIIGGDVPEKDRTQGAIQPVFDELVKLKEINDARIKRVTGEEKEKLGALTMEMDKGHRFKLMKRIMLSAQQAEFLTFKLTVSKHVQ